MSSRRTDMVIETKASYSADGIGFEGGEAELVELLSGDQRALLEEGIESLSILPEDAVVEAVVFRVFRDSSLTTTIWRKPFSD